MKKLLLAASVFVIASCTASISIKAQEFNGDPGMQPLPEVAPLSPNKNKESTPNYPDTVQQTTLTFALPASGNEQQRLSSNQEISSCEFSPAPLGWSDCSQSNELKIQKANHLTN